MLPNKKYVLYMINVFDSILPIKNRLDFTMSYWHCSYEGRLDAQRNVRNSQPVSERYLEYVQWTILFSGFFTMNFFASNIWSYHDKIEFESNGMLMLHLSSFKSDKQSRYFIKFWIWLTLDFWCRRIIKLRVYILHFISQITMYSIHMLVTNT